MRSLTFPICLCLLTVGFSSAGQLIRVTSVPHQPTVQAMIRDSAGNLYLGGSVAAAHPRSQFDTDAFVSELSADGSKVIFWTVLSGSEEESAGALAFAPDGSILVAGSTSSTDFPITTNAAETTSAAGTNGVTGFFAKLDANGSVVYASYLNGSSTYTVPKALTVDSSGAAYITGTGQFASTPGAIPVTANTSPSSFVVKLDASGKTVFSTGAMGGSVIAVDTEGSIYVAGSDFGQQPFPATPGAFQPAVLGTGCGGAYVVTPCSHQYVAKLDAAASTLVYATWLSGTYDDSPIGIAPDGEGNCHYCRRNWLD